MNKHEAQKQYEMLISEAEKLKKIIDGTEWEPSNGYYYVTLNGEVNEIQKGHGYLAKMFGTVFKTEEQAQKRAKQVKFQNWIFHLAEDLNEGWEPDWLNFNEVKCHIVYDYELRSFDYESILYINDLSTVYFKDRETAEKAIEIIKTCDWVEL